MGAAENAVDAGAQFIGPFLERRSKDHPKVAQDSIDADELVEQALFHLQQINSTDQAKEPDSPYDGSLVGVIYGLLDLITAVGIVPFLSPGLRFSHRPQSVLALFVLKYHAYRDETFLKVVQALLAIAEQQGNLGVHPLLAQHILPDLFSATAELGLAPRRNGPQQPAFNAQFEKLLVTTSTSRLLPILTIFLQQQDLPPWLRPKLARELALIPLRPHGVRHTVEFLCLSYLSKNTQMPADVGGSQSQVPIPVEAVSHVSRLLSSIPQGMEASEWFSRLAPQLWTLLDGTDGIELSRAAGQVIMSGILNRRAIGAPGTIGWQLFAVPILQAINPVHSPAIPRVPDHTIVGEQDFMLGLKRLSALLAASSQAGVIRRLVHPVLLPLWGLLEYTKLRPSLDQTWRELPRSILLRYLHTACDPAKLDVIADNLLWEGAPSWTFAPGSDGGVEIRSRRLEEQDLDVMAGLLSNMGEVDDRVASFVTILGDALIADETTTAIFTRTTERWLGAGRASRPSLLHEDDVNPLNALINAKLSEAMLNKFKERFARNPQDIVHLMTQILQNFGDEHKAKVKEVFERDSNKPSRAALRNLVRPKGGQDGQEAGVSIDTESEELVSFALSVLNMTIANPTFDPKDPKAAVLSSTIPALEYLAQPHTNLPISPLLSSSATNLLTFLRPAPTQSSTTISSTQQQPQKKDTDPSILKLVLQNLTAPDAPDRTWALTTLRDLIADPSSFAALDIPSITHLLLDASVADPESYVHTVAIPVLVDLAIHAPSPVLRIIVDAFIDVDERSLRQVRSKRTQKEKEDEVRHALDFRLRVGEVLNQFVLRDEYFDPHAGAGMGIGRRLESLKMVLDAVLLIASRRGQRKQTLSTRTALATLEQQKQEEAEAAWGGPIPNLLDSEAENPDEQADRDALLKILSGWEDTGIEEDVRIRVSAMSILGTLMEKRVALLKQVSVDAGLQMVLQILVIEGGDEKAILRRAAVLVVLGLLKGMDEELEKGSETNAGLSVNQMVEVERVLLWVRDMDGDTLVKGHAETVLEGLETWRMKKLFRLHDQQNAMFSANLGLSETLQGLNVRPSVQSEGAHVASPRGFVIEEIE